MYEKFVSNTEVGTSETGDIKSDKFQTFMRQNRPALRQLFSEEEVNGMAAVAADLNRANRSLTVGRTPGRSTTAQDQFKNVFKKPEAGGDHGISFFTQLILAAGEGYGHGGITGAALTGGGVIAKQAVQKFIGRARARGMEQVGDIVKDAMLHPEEARRLLAKVAPEGAPHPGTLTAGKTYLRSQAIGPQQQSEHRTAP